MKKSSGCNWKFIWIVIIWTIGFIVFDLTYRYAKWGEWLISEKLSYFLSIIFSVLWTITLGYWGIRWFVHKKWIMIPLILIIGIIESFIYLASYKFYSIFKTVPNVVSVRFALEETEDFLTNFQPNAMTLFVWPLFTLLIAVFWYFWGNICARYKDKIPLRKSALILVLVLFPIFHNNVWISQGNITPGVNMTFSITKAFHQIISGKQNVRTLQVRQIPQLPKIDNQPPYNFILIVNESLRARNCSFYGHDRKTTPNLDNFLLEKYPERSFIFNRGYSNSTNTHLSLPSILSGLHPGQSHQELHSAPVFYEYAKMFPHYKTFMISSHSHDYGNFRLYLQSPHLDFWWNREIGKKPAFNTVGANDKYIYEEFVKFLDGINLSKNKIFGVFQFNATHYPYHVPQEFRKWGKASAEDVEKGYRYTTDYDDSIRYLDFVVGKILNELEKRNMVDNTVIISTSDHGEGFGEHKGQYGHLQSFYEEGTVVPFWIYLPEKLAEHYRSILEKNIPKPVQNLDIIPSFLDILKLDEVEALSAVRSKLSGYSVFSAIPDDRYIIIQNTNAYYTNQFAGIGVVQGSDKFLFNAYGKKIIKEYFDLDKDPGEENNLWDQLPSDKLKRLKEVLRKDEFLKKWLKKYFFPDL